MIKKITAALTAGLTSKKTTILGAVVAGLSFAGEEGFDPSDPKAWVNLVLSLALILARDADKSSEDSLKIKG